DFAFTGLIRCGECGAMITAEDKTKKQKNGNVHYYTYYHCTKRKNPDCSQKTIRQEELENQIKEVLDQIEIPEDFKEWALEIIKDQNKQESGSRGQILTNLQKEYNICVKKIDRLIDMRANEEINEEEFASKKSELSKEKSRLQELLGDTDKRVDDWIEKAETMLNFAEKAKSKFESGTLEEKRAILSILGSNLSLKDGKLTVNLQKPLTCIKSAVPEIKAIHNRLEPLKIGFNKRKMGVFYSQNSMLLPIWNAFRTVNWNRIWEEVQIFQRSLNFNLALSNI
ncbi:MAG: zinc ribbon domain-containing protein, partial [bacterium]